MKFFNVSGLSEAMGGPDLVIIKFLGWWSPAPWWEGLSYICCSYMYGNLGNTYNGQGTVDLDVYLIYEDNEVFRTIPTTTNIINTFGTIIKT